MAALAFCEFLTEKGDALVKVAFQLTKWELQAVITYKRIYNFETILTFCLLNFSKIQLSMSPDEWLNGL